LDGAKAECSEGTIKIYTKHLKTFSAWLMEQESISEYGSITRNHIRRFIEYLTAKKTSGEWADATYLQSLRSLRTFLHWVCRDPDCAEEGFDKRKLHLYLPSIPQSAPRNDIPPNADLKKFRTSFKTDTICGFRDYVISTLLMSDGIRAGEVCNLTLQALHLTDMPPTMVVDGKTGPRSVPLSKDMVRLLRAWLKRRAMLSPATDSPYVFVTRTSPQMNSTVLGKSFRRNRAKHNLPRISPHTFRHAFCTNYLKNGGDLHRLKTITGHKTYQMLDQYVKKSSEVSQVAHEELERMKLLEDC